MIRAALSTIGGSVPRLIVCATILATLVTWWGLGGPACGVALVVQAVWAPTFILAYLAIRTISDVAGVLQVDEEPRD